MHSNQIVISKQAAAALEDALKWVQSLEKAMLEEHMKGNDVLAKQLFKEYEDAQLNIRIVMQTYGLPVPPLKVKVILPF